MLKKTRDLSRIAVTLIAVATLAACSTPIKEETPPPVVTDRSTQSGGQPAVTTGQGASTVATVDLGKELDAAVSNKRIVYFDFDSYVVKDEFRSTIDAHAKRLNNNRKIAMSLEGHTDERGGREYNLALGQKRAEAVAKSLGLLGVQAAQVEPVSYGKERPAAAGSNEEAWAKNRRVELKDK